MVSFALVVFTVILVRLTMLIQCLFLFILVDGGGSLTTYVYMYIQCELHNDTKKFPFARPVLARPCSIVSGGTVGVVLLRLVVSTARHPQHPPGLARGRRDPGDPFHHCCHGEQCLRHVALGLDLVNGPLGRHEFGFGAAKAVQKKVGQSTGRTSQARA